MTYPPNSENDPNQGTEGTPAQPQDPGSAPAAPYVAPPQPPQYAAPQQPQYASPQYSTPQQPHYAPPQYAAPQQPQYAPPQYAYSVPGPGGPFDGASSPDQLTRPLYGATFSQAVRRFFKNYANFSGRASRSEYWWIVLFGALLSIIPTILYVIGVFSMGFGASMRDSYGYGYANPGGDAAFGVGLTVLIVAAIMYFAIVAGTLVPSIAVAWRRLHDANLAGPLYFLALIPYAGGLVLLVLTLLSPKPEGRRFDR